MRTLLRWVVVGLVAVLGVGALAVATEEPSKEEVTLVFGGDVLLAHHLDYFMEKFGLEYPFLRIGDQLRAADIAFCNQEAPIATTGKKVGDKQFLFRCKPYAVEALNLAGFDIVSLANNHIGDYGDEAVVETLELLEAGGIASCGAGRTIKEAARPSVIERNGVKFGFIGYSKTFPFSFFAKEDKPGSLGGDINRVEGDIAACLKVADVCIVSVHWGAELMTTPKAYQKTFGRRCIDAGAHLVIGHHPHVLQGFEYYKHGFIAYSLGNLAFASYSRNVKDSALLTVRMRGEEITGAELDGLDVYNPRVDMQPRYLDDEKGKALMEELDALSRKLGARVEHTGKQRGRVVPITATSP